MTSFNATQARAHFFDILRDVTQTHEPVCVTHKEKKVIMVAEEDYDSLLETLELLSSPNFRKKFKRSREQIQKGQTLSLDEVFGG